MRFSRWKSALLALALGACAFGTAERAPLPTTQRDVIFERYSELARPMEIARRTQTPVTFFYLKEGLEAAHKHLPEQAVSLDRERFALYVPTGEPPRNGYGLLVFISPTDEPVVPVATRSILERHSTIAVSAANSGNRQSVVDRRLPLALLAYANVQARYPVDPNRVYVGGFSGGALAAEIAALAYPDIFRGAVLNAGAERIDGEEGIFLPSPELFHRFQQTRLILVTGDMDADALTAEEAARASFRRSCVFDVHARHMRHTGHALIDPDSENAALSLLELPTAADASALSHCNARIQSELAAAVSEASTLLDRGEKTAAKARIQAIDKRFGGLATAELLQLDGRLHGRAP